MVVYLIPALLTLLAVLLVVFQYVTMVKFAVIPTAVSYLSFSAFSEVVASRVSFSLVDGVLLGCIVAVAVGILVSEGVGRYLSKFLSAVFRSEIQTLVLLLTCSMVFVRFYFSVGAFNWSADSAQHIYFADIAARTLAQGEWPWWTNYLGSGSPYLQFYGFLFFVVTGGLATLTGTATALKLTLGVCHALSGLGLYAVARKSGCSRAASFVGGCAYVLSFWHTQQVLIMGRLPLSLLYALLPWTLYGYESARRDHGKLRYAMLGGIALGLVILTHPGYGYWTCVFVGLYMLLRTITSSISWSRVGLAPPLLLLVVGLLVGAPLVLPMWVDRGLTGLAHGFSLADVPDPRWWHLFVWSNYRFWAIPPTSSGFNWYSGYLGLSLVLLACSWLIPTASSRRLWWRIAPGLLLLLATFILVLGYRTWLVRHLPGAFVVCRSPFGTSREELLWARCCSLYVILDPRHFSNPTGLRIRAQTLSDFLSKGTRLCKLPRALLRRAVNCLTIVRYFSIRESIRI